MNAMHEVDYKIFGEDLQYVEVELDPQEAVVAEAGGMMYMEDGIEMETIFGDGSAQQQAGGFMGALMGAGKRLLTGESLFMTVFQNRAAGKRRVAFGAPYPGRIVPVHLAELGGELIVQKDAFLAAAKGVSIGIAFQKKLGVGLFGGEGFIMQRLQGDGWAFIHAGGMLMERQLAAGEACASTPAASSASSPRWPTTSRWWEASSRRSSAARGCSSRRCRGPGRSGCSRCRSRGWPAGSSPPCRGSGAAGARRGRSSAVSAASSAATAEKSPSAALRSSRRPAAYTSTPRPSFVARLASRPF